MLVHTHASESRDEIDVVRQLSGGLSNLEYLAATGLASHRLCVAHCVWASDAEQGLLAERDVKVMHCPGSNLKLGSGIAPVVDMRRRGISVSLGADGAVRRLHLAGPLLGRLLLFVLGDGEARQAALRQRNRRRHRQEQAGQEGQRHELGEPRHPSGNHALPRQGAHARGRVGDQGIDDRRAVGARAPLEGRGDAVLQGVAAVSETRDVGYIQDQALFKVRPMVAAIEGVSAPPPFGGSQRTVVVRVDPDRLHNYGLSADDVVKKLSEGNTIAPSGQLRDETRMFLVPSNAMVVKPE